MATSAPSVPPRLVEYFVAEAAGYTDSLREIMWLPAPSRDTGKMLSAARALRGASTMVRLSDLAVVAGRMERIARALHTRRIQWTEPLSYSLQAVLYELPELIAAAGIWGRGESERAAAIADALQAFAPSDERKDGSMVVPITRLFHDDAGPHVIYVAVTPQTQFEQQLREPPPHETGSTRAGARPRAPQAGAPAEIPAVGDPARAAPAVVAAATAAAAAPEAAPPARPAVPAATPPPARVLGDVERATPRGQELHTLISEGLAGFASIDFDGAAGAPPPLETVVPIESLLYAGRAALARAREIRAAQAAAAREPTPEELDELMDLMELAAST